MTATPAKARENGAFGPAPTGIVRQVTSGIASSLPGAGSGAGSGAGPGAGSGAGPGAATMALILVAGSDNCLSATIEGTEAPVAVGTKVRPARGRRGNEPHCPVAGVQG